MTLRRPAPFIQSAAFKAIERAATRGQLTLITPDGAERIFAGTKPGRDARLIVHDWAIAGAVTARGDIGLGEAYIKGWWDSPDVESFIAWGIDNVGGLGRLAWGSPLRRLESVLRDRIWRRNSIAGAKRNIMTHYDLGNEFYALWLDPSMSYSSAIFDTPQTTLAAGQARKYDRILGEIGQREDVLEIGCGWGGFIARAHGEGRRVTALTISQQQYDFARGRAGAGAGADVRLLDYRLSTGRFPAVVSIEMLEAVGERYWREYFKTVRARLTGDGVALIQTITIRDDMFQSYRSCSDYIRHFIFQGGMLPSLARIREEAGAAGLAVCGVHSFGQDYARTLREWLARFDAASGTVRGLGYNDAFQRGWRLYLAMSAAAFSAGRTDVHQIALAPVRG